MIALLKKIRAKWHNDIKADIERASAEIVASKHLEDMLKKYDEKLDAVKAFCDVKFTDQKKALDTVKAFCDTEFANRIMYYCPHEVYFIENNGFYEIRKKDEYASLYSNLIRGLDVESIKTVNQLLSRHLLIKGKANQRLDIFTVEEKKTIQRLNDEFYSQILKINDELFTYDGMMFPYPQVGMGWTETTVFYDKCGLVKVDNPEYMRNKCILDIGAFAGDSSAVFSKLTDEKVFAFEAAPANYDLLCKMISVNGITNVVPVMAAVGEGNGTAVMPSQLSMGNAVIESDGGEDTVEVEMVAIDDFVEKNDIKVGMIKVDIEGFEMKFLRGAQKTICEQKPILLISIYHSANDFFGIKPLIESWGLGYRFRIHKEVNEHIHYDMMLIAEIV